VGKRTIWGVPAVWGGENGIEVGWGLVNSGGRLLRAGREEERPEECRSL